MWLFIQSPTQADSKLRKIPLCLVSTLRFD
jgi:hypothetical protein